MKRYRSVKLDSDLQQQFDVQDEYDATEFEEMEELDVMDSMEALSELAVMDGEDAFEDESEE